MKMKEYYEKYGDGDFHIVIGDGNVEELWINKALKEAKEKYDDAKSLVDYLLTLSEEERYKEFKKLYY